LEKVEFRLENEALDMLLFNFLGELIFYKDARLLLLRVISVIFSRAGTRFALNAEAHGEFLDPARHPMVVDVKAVTLHRFKVEKTEDMWRAEVVLDI
jgi:SHS2 domain-containing protein